MLILLGDTSQKPIPSLKYYFNKENELSEEAG